jgi:hypothetical protein
MNTFSGILFFGLVNILFFEDEWKKLSTVTIDVWFSVLHSIILGTVIPYQ